MDFEPLAEEINRELRNKGIDGYIVAVPNGLETDPFSGDWKHTHLAFDAVVKQVLDEEGYKGDVTHVATEEVTDDWFEAVHYVRNIKGKANGHRVKDGYIYLEKDVRVKKVGSVVKIERWEVPEEEFGSWHTIVDIHETTLLDVLSLCDTVTQDVQKGMIDGLEDGDCLQSPDGETYIKVINKDKGVIEQVNGRIDGVCKLTVQPNSFVKSFGDYKHLSVEDYDRAKVISCLNNKPCKAFNGDYFKITGRYKDRLTFCDYITATVNSAGEYYSEGEHSFISIPLSYLTTLQQVSEEEWEKAVSQSRCV